MNKKRLGKDYKELGMRMSREMYDALRHAADVSERSVSSQIRYCCRRLLESQGYLNTIEGSNYIKALKREADTYAEKGDKYDDRDANGRRQRWS
tara:strand:- start:368 stop:649 length:282 start_codon:yes stop_codon:yes gene_type:complete